VCSALELLVAGWFYLHRVPCSALRRGCCWGEPAAEAGCVSHCRLQLKTCPARGTGRCHGALGAGVVTQCPLVRGVTVFNVLGANLSLNRSNLAEFSTEGAITNEGDEIKKTHKNQMC